MHGLEPLLLVYAAVGIHQHVPASSLMVPVLRELPQGTTGSLEAMLSEWTSIASLLQQAATRPARALWLHLRVRALRPRRCHAASLHHTLPRRCRG